jgi:hypothetical protein
MPKSAFNVEIDEIVVDSRLRMTRARIEQAIMEEVERMLHYVDPSGLQLDQDGGVMIHELTLTASNAMSPVRLGEAVAGAISTPLGDLQHPTRVPTPTPNTASGEPT